MKTENEEIRRAAGILYQERNIRSERSWPGIHDGCNEGLGREGAYI